MTKANVLPARPNLEYLKKLAKKQVASSRRQGKAISLALAQLTLARQFGFASWRKLKTHVDLLIQQQRIKDQASDSNEAVNPPHVFRDLMKAILRRDHETLSRLLTKTPEVVNRTGPHPEWGGRPQPLHVAIEVGNFLAFESLLNAGADINGNNETYDRWSPLMLAIHWKRNTMRDALLRRRAKVDLIAALMLRDDRRVARLVRDPSALKGPFPNNATPLHFAGTVKSARLLLSHGVNAMARNKYGKTAAQLWDSAKPRSAGLMRLANSIGDQPASDIYQAVEQGRLTLVRKMLAKGASANSRFPAGSRGTLLHAAAWNGDLPMVKLRVAKGADVHALDLEHKVTSAHYARHALKVFDRQSCAPVAEYLETLVNP
jgi:ankyrin repeat protein